MSQKKAKKKKPLDIYARQYNYAEVQAIAEELANAKAVELYRQRAAKDIDKAIGVVLMLTCIVLEDLFSFGGGRLLKYHEEMDLRLTDYEEGKFSLADIIEVYKGGIWKKVKAYAKRKGINIEYLTREE